MARLGGQGQRQEKLSLLKMGKLPVSCTRHNPRGKRLSAAIDDDADSWEVHAVACKRMRMGPRPPARHPCSFCSKSFRSAQALGGHMHVHPDERMALKARAKAAALAAATAREIRLCNEIAAAAATSTPKIHVSSHVQAPVDVRAPVNVAAATSTPKIPAGSPVDVAGVGAVEILRPPALSNQESGMAELMSSLGLAPEEPGTSTGFIPPPPPLLKLPLRESVTSSALIPPAALIPPPLPLLKLSLPELVTTNALIPPPVINLPLQQSTITPVVLKHPHSFSKTGKFRPQQSVEFPLWQKRKSNFPLSQQRRRSSLVMPSPPVSISLSAQSTFHSYQRELVQLGRFSVMASTPLDLELRLGRSSDN